MQHKNVHLHCALQASPGGPARALSRANYPLSAHIYWVPVQPKGEARPHKALKQLEKPSPRSGAGKMWQVARQAGRAPVKRATSVQVFTRLARVVNNLLNGRMDFCKKSKANVAGCVKNCFRVSTFPRLRRLPAKFFVGTRFLNFLLAPGFLLTDFRKWPLYLPFVYLGFYWLFLAYILAFI